MLTVPRCDVRASVYNALDDVIATGTALRAVASRCFVAFAGMATAHFVCCRHGWPLINVVTGCAKEE